MANDVFVPNDSQQAVQGSSDGEVVPMEAVLRAITGPLTPEGPGLCHTRGANYDRVSAKHYSSQYINVVHLNFTMFVFEFLFSWLSCLEHVRALTMNVYI